MRNTITADDGRVYVEKRRTPRKTLVTIGTLVLLLVAGVAFALYLLTAKVGGSATTRTLDYSWASSVNPTTSGSAAVCNATISAPGTSNSLNVNVSSYPGDTCTVTASLFTAGSESAKVTGIALTGLPTGWKAEVEPGTCGATIGGTPTPVSLKITVGPSGTGTIGGGLQLTPVSQAANSVTCAAQTAP